MKNTKRLLAMILIASICAGTVNMPVYAEENLPEEEIVEIEESEESEEIVEGEVTETETKANEDGTTTELTTTTTTEIGEDGKVTVTVTIGQTTEGTNTDGAVVEGNATSTEVTVTDGEGEVIEQTSDSESTTTVTETVTDEESGETTVTETVTETKSSEVTDEENPAENTKSEYEQTTVTETITNADGLEIGSSVEVSGSETMEWTEEDTGDGEQTPVDVDIIPGQTTVGTVTETVVDGDTPEGDDDTSYNYTETTTTDRTVTVDASDVEVKYEKNSSELKGLQSELKFNRDGSDKSVQGLNRELYADNGHFADPESFMKDADNDGTPDAFEDAPEGYDYKFVGNGDYSAHYVSHIRVIYERDDDGNPIKDENGEYIIKELQHSNGTTLTYKGVPTTSLEGPFDQTTGTRPQQFLLMNENGDAIYTYCVDLETGAEKNYWYKVSNLEDNDYYASEDAENHIRNIVTNGYWGTAEGETGCLSQMKESLKEAVASGAVEKEHDITFVIRIQKYTEGYELKEGEYIASGYVCKHVTEHIVLTDEVIDALTEGEALDATQSAVWSYANGANCALDGTDGMIIGDITYASSALGDGRNKQNDFAGAARTKALYNYLIGLDEKMDSTVVINDKNNIEDITLTVGDKAEGYTENTDNDQDNDIYEADLNFTLEFVPDPETDDLLVHITYTSNGVTETIIRRLAGTNTEGRSHETILPDDNGVYTLTGLHLSENQDFEFDLRIDGTQYLENAVYVFTAEGGIDNSQTFVGMAEGTNTVDVCKTLTLSFDVDENNHVVAAQNWYDKYDPKVDPDETDPEETDPIETVPEETKPTETEPEETDPEETEPEETEPTETDPVETDPVETIPEETEPAAPADEPVIIIEDEDIPLTDIPDEPIPQTGDSFAWYIVSVIAGLGLAVVSFFDRKKKTNA